MKRIIYNLFTLRFQNTQKLSTASIIFFVAFFVVLLFINNSATAATYYLDSNNGDDSNPGTSDQPWKTIDRAYTWYNGAGSKVQEGDTVLFRNGIYSDFVEDTGISEAYLFYRNDWITYKADFGHNPVLSNIMIENSDKWGGAGDGNSYLIFDGFDIPKSVVINYTSYIKIINNTIQQPVVAGVSGYWEPYLAGTCISSRGSHNITIQGNDISQGYRGLVTKTSDSDWLIADNTFHHFGEDGLSAPTCNGITLRNNYFYDLRPNCTKMNIRGVINGTFLTGEVINMPTTDATCIFEGTQGADYISIYLTSGPNTAFTYWKSDNTLTVSGTISGAVISPITDIDRTHTDCFQIHGTATNITITGNIIDRSRYIGTGTENGQGFKLAGNPSNIQFENNLVIASVIGLINGTYNCNIVNNTFWDAAGGFLRIFNASASFDTLITNFYNNLCTRLLQESDSEGRTVWIENHGNNIFGSNPNGAGGPTHPFTVNGSEIIDHNVDSLFFDSANNKFTLATESAAINFGNAAYAPPIDILGYTRDASPDAGCYEYIPGISPTNHPPVFDPIGNKSVIANYLLTFTVNATDPDGDDLIYWATDLPLGAVFDYVTRTFSWTPTVNQSGIHSLTFKVRDDLSITSESITITVNNIINVPTDANSIQEAVDTAQDNDVVIVKDGIYTGTGNRDIDFQGKAITVRSENGPQNCIIDCEGTVDDYHRGFFFNNGEDENSIVDGFTITNGYAYGDNDDRSGGGAIRCDNSSPTIKNCIFTYNTAVWNGGAINNDHSSPLIDNCEFITNVALNNDGGGINNGYESHPSITNCTFIANYAYDWGGAIRNVFSSNPTISNCLIIYNISNRGAGIFNNDSNPTILNCTMSNNTTSSSGGAIDSGGSAIDGEGSLTKVTNCIIWANSDPEISGDRFDISYTNIQGGWPGQANMDINPLFTDPGNADYHLKSQTGRWDQTAGWIIDSVTSPCIDAGDPNSAVSGELWPHGQRINIGAYAGTLQASMSISSTGHIADFNSDGTVNTNDLLLLFDAWLLRDTPAAEDINRDNIVNIADFTKFKQYLGLAE